jgi:TatD DNase family protein
LIDIGANLLDDRFLHGIYRGTPRHESDLVQVWQRAHDTGVRRIILTAGTVEESRQAVQMARQWNCAPDNPGIRFACTVGVHPTRCQQVFVDNDKSADDLLQELLDIAQDGMTDGTTVAIGEIGLDYDRLEFCPKNVQHTYLIQQLQCLAKPTKLPLLLHNRNTGDDLYQVLVEHKDCWMTGGGVVHSFDDSATLATQFMQDLGLYIGLNGCSLRTIESLQVVCESIPVDRILLETDCPYCEIRSTHPGHLHVQTTWPSKAEKKFVRGHTVKNRQEPCQIRQVAEVVAATKNMDLQELTEVVYQNTCRLYGWSNNDDDD